MHRRDAERGARAVAEIEKAGGGATFKADLASLADVRVASAVQEATDPLDILTNNAGIGTAGGVRQESEDGSSCASLSITWPGFC